MKAKILALGCIIFFLTGCYQHTVFSEQINLANKLCEPNGGISSIDSIASSGKDRVALYTRITCANGAVFTKGDSE